MPRSKPNPELIDPDAPEATDEWFARARPAKEVLAGLLGDAPVREMLKPKRGRQARDTSGNASGCRMDSNDKSTSRRGQ